MKAWNGMLQIDSIVGKGTTAFIVLPLSDPPKWFVSDLTIGSGETVIVLDDDASVHHIWRDRFNACGINTALFTFEKAEEFLWWWKRKKKSHKDCLFLCDYSLAGRELNGLDVIRKAGLRKQAILVTNYFNNERVRQACLSMGIRLLSKDMVNVIPIRRKSGGKEGVQTG